MQERQEDRLHIVSLDQIEVAASKVRHLRLHVYPGAGERGLFHKLDELIIGWDKGLSRL